MPFGLCILLACFPVWGCVATAGSDSADDGGPRDAFAGGSRDAVKLDSPSVADGRGRDAAAPAPMPDGGFPDAGAAEPLGCWWQPCGCGEPDCGACSEQVVSGVSIPDPLS